MSQVLPNTGRSGFVPSESTGSSGSSHLHHKQFSSLTSPLTEKQYLSYLDSEGRIKSQRELRITIYRKGVEPSLRKTVWKQILNVYPPGLTGQQRIDYMKAKCELYNSMKSLWQNNLPNDPRVENIYSMVSHDDDPICFSSLALNINNSNLSSKKHFGDPSLVSAHQIISLDLVLD